LLIAMAVRPYLGTYAFLSYEGIVLWNPSVGMQPHQLALQLVQLLRRGALIVFSQRNEEIAFAIEYQARAEMRAGRQGRLLGENNLEIVERRAIGAQFSVAD